MCSKNNTPEISISSMYYPTDKITKIKMELEEGGVGIIIYSKKQNCISGAWSISKFEKEGLDGVETQIQKVNNSIFSSLRMMLRKQENLEHFKESLQSIPEPILYLVGDFSKILNQLISKKVKHVESTLKWKGYSKVSFTKNKQFYLSKK